MLISLVTQSFFQLFVAYHAIYLSVIEISLVDSQMEIEIKVFEDDLQDALRNYGGSSVKDSILTAYFNEYVSLTVDREEVWMELEEFSLEGDSYFIRFVHRELPVETLLLSVPYFMELFPAQQNILKCDLGKQRVYHIFSKPDETYTVQVSP